MIFAKHGLRSRQKMAVAPLAGVAGGLESGANTKAFAAHRTAEVNAVADIFGICQCRQIQGYCPPFFTGHL
jgi:hypothetical protein